jgi:hypothetical protein
VTAPADPRVRALEAANAAVGIAERIDLRKVNRSAPERFPEEFWAKVAESLMWSALARVVGPPPRDLLSSIPGSPQPIPPPEVRAVPAPHMVAGPQRATRRQSMPAGQITALTPTSQEAQQ